VNVKLGWKFSVIALKLVFSFCGGVILENSRWVTKIVMQLEYEKGMVPLILPMFTVRKLVDENLA